MSGFNTSATMTDAQFNFVARLIADTDVNNGLSKWSRVTPSSGDFVANTIDGNGNPVKVKVADTYRVDLYNVDNFQLTGFQCDDNMGLQLYTSIVKSYTGLQDTILNGLFAA